MNLDILRRSLRDMKRSARQAEREFNEALSEAADGAFVFNRADRIARRQCHSVKLRLMASPNEPPAVPSAVAQASRLCAQRASRLLPQTPRTTRDRLARAVRRIELEVFAK